MKSFVLLLPVLITGFLACKQKNNQPASPVSSTAQDTTHATYLPVADFITNDIKLVDSFAGGILRKTITYDRKDSGYITIKGFDQFAKANFVLPELDSAGFKNNFTEESLMDETAELLTFIYTAKNTGSPLRKVMVYLNPGSNIAQVNRVYMEKEFASGDTLVQQKLTWKIKHSCYVLTIRQPKQGTATNSLEKIIWDPQHFAED